MDARPALRARSQAEILGRQTQAEESHHPFHVRIRRPAHGPGTGRRGHRREHPHRPDPALEKNKDIVVNRFPSQMVEYVYVNCQNEKLKDPAVRQALSYAVDYQGIIDHVLQGNGVQMRGPIPDGMWGHRKDVFQYKLDVAKAKELLKAAGAENLELTLIYSERRATWEQIALVMQANLADIGVKLNLELMANPTLRDKIDKGDFDLCLGAWSPDSRTPTCS
jgi:ABC-type dipeptide transport system, periplasmic component